MECCFINIGHFIDFADDNARRGESHYRNCRCLENWSSCHEGNAESNVCIIFHFVYFIIFAHTRCGSDIMLNFSLSNILFQILIAGDKT